MLKKLMVSAAVVAAWVVAPAAHAQETWQPSATLKMVVPFPPGGPTDALARRLAEGVSKELEQTVIVENRGGAGGNIGAEYVANARPDGTTILFGTSGPLAINYSLYSKQNYHPQTSFEPIIRIGHLPNVLVVRKDLPVSNVAELVAYEKKNPESLVYASSGNGASSHLAGILFNRMSGTSIRHIPYRGTGPALTDLLGGQVDMTFTDIMMVLPHIKSGAVKPIGIATKERSDALADLASISEQGLDGYDVSVFFGLVAPKGTPEAAITAWNEAVRKVLTYEEIEQTLKAQGIVLAEDQSPEGLARFIQSDLEKWGKVIKEENIVLD